MASDSEVLRFIGHHGKTPDQIRERFPDFDVERLLRAGLVRLHRVEIARGETEAHGTPPAPDAVYYVLTPRGAEAVGIDPRTLPA